MLLQLPRDRADFMHFIAILKQGTTTNMVVRTWTDSKKSLLKEFDDFATLSLSYVALIWYWSLCQADKKSWNGERLNYKTEERWTSDLKHQTEQNLVD